MNALTATLLLGIAAVLILLAWAPSSTNLRLAVAPRRDSFNERFSRRLKLAGIYHQAPSYVVVAVAGTALLAGIVGFVLSGSFAGMVFGIVIAPIGAYLMLIRQERMFLRRATKELIPFFNRFEASVRARTPPSIAYRDAVNNSTVLKQALGDSAAKLAAGAEFVPTLLETMDQFPLRIWRIFVRQLETHDTSGGDLVSALTTTVSELNEMISLTAEAAADSASDRFQQLMITFIVIGGIFGFSLVLGLETMSRLWTTVPGAIGGIIGLSMMGGGFWYSLKILRLVEKRTIGEN